MTELRPSIGMAVISHDRLFDQAPGWISIQNREFRVIHANRRLLADFGDHRQELCYAVYKRRSEPCPQCPVVHTFEDGREHSSQETIFDKRGLPHDVLVNTSPVRDEAGQVVAVMKLFADISAEKELEHRLQESLVRFGNLFDNAPCRITVQDRHFRILEANGRFTESFGDSIGLHCYEAYKHRQERCARCPVAETFEDGEIHTSEETVVDNLGRQQHVLVYAAPLRDRDGAIPAVMEMSTDITEIRTLQNRLASLGELVAGTAHTIKNILEGLRGGVYIVNLGFRNNRDADVRTGWEMVERNLGRLSAVIMDMLSCARDRLPRKLPVALHSVLSDAITLFTPRASQFGIRVESDIAAPIEALGESKDIHAMIASLLTNAIDACNEDQADKDHCIKVRLYREAGGAVLEVEDNGAGMSGETRQALFHGLVSTKGSAGTGLGLMVAHKIATEHGGRIDVRSEPGSGSLFAVTLPIA